MTVVNCLPLIIMQEVTLKFPDKESLLRFIAIVGLTKLYIDEVCQVLKACLDEPEIELALNGFNATIDGNR